ncbi:MAG: endopeptidase La [Deltaproteobacteria bacterium]|nr:endopeptidase La [Deltaproteobacteria bacterium]MBW2393655.1 endopeptidase La [Deltaproteobacteria bacterium]
MATDTSSSFDFGIPDELPILPLREFVVFPYMVLPIFVSRERSIAAVEDALAGDRLVLLTAQRNADVEDPDADDLHRVGTVAMVMRILRLPDGRVKALVQGLTKARIDSFVDSEPATWAAVSALPEEAEGEWCVEAEALMRTVRSRVEELLPLKNLPPEVLSITANVFEPGRLADLVASNLKLRLGEAQEVLEVSDPIARLRKVDRLLQRELDVTTMQAEIQSQAKEEISRGQREHYLREQLRAIQAELGEVDPRMEESAEYRMKIEEAGLPPEPLEEAMKQLRRFERMHPDGPEAQVVRSYLEWMTDLPWSRTSPDRLDLAQAREILDHDHAHLEGIKDRILEFLGVRKLRSDSQGSILCFVGPPGVGKTSLGRSIARAMGREFVRISLGGIRDEAEVRGHRRTYVGALPGRIIQGLKQAGTKNPVFMLDEIDKLGNDYRGDPSSSLLEVLDPEQNSKFSDHYLNVPFDLSGVFFVATANLLDSVPGPLRDRMEVIRVPGYTPEEKLDIARSYLVPRQVEASGLPSDRIQWSDSALSTIITDYTYEAGVRGLERQIASVCRKAARRAAEGDESSLRAGKRSLVKYLGPPRFAQDEIGSEGEIGVTNGLAWTEAGGDVLRVEAATTRGRGLVLTGQLGDVMKESGYAALTWARSRVAEMGADVTRLERNEVHVHVPAGAIPKDGPSAGVTMATAMISLATGVPLRPDVAMTGEVTLVGKVLPVGGVREKALAALRAGIKTVILPERNLADVKEIPREIARRIHFVGASHMDDVLEAALDGKLPGSKRTVRRSSGRTARTSTATAKPRS